MNEKEKQALESVKSMFEYATIEELIKNKDFNLTIYSLGIIDVLRVIAIVEKQQEEIENAKWYAYQMKARISEDIADFIDDGKEENRDIIGELKETRKQWQDIEKLLNGESKDNLYNDWRKYGEYE